MRNAVLLLGIGMVLGTAAAWGVGALASREQAYLCAGAAGLCFVTGVLGFVPAAIGSRRTPGGAAYGFLVGMIVRMAVCGGVAVAAQYAGGRAGRIFAIWVAIWYLIALAVEVSLLSSHTSRAAAATKAGGDSLSEPPPSA